MMWLVIKSKYEKLKSEYDKLKKAYDKLQQSNNLLVRKAIAENDMAQRGQIVCSFYCGKCEYATIVTDCYSGARYECLLNCKCKEFKKKEDY